MNCVDLAQSLLVQETRFIPPIPYIFSTKNEFLVDHNEYWGRGEHFYEHFYGDFQDQQYYRICVVPIPESEKWFKYSAQWFSAYLGKYRR